MYKMYVSSILCATLTCTAQAFLIHDSNLQISTFVFKSSSHATYHACILFRTIFLSQEPPHLNMEIEMLLHSTNPLFRCFICHTCFIFYMKHQCILCDRQRYSFPGNRLPHQCRKRPLLRSVFCILYVVFFILYLQYI